jgi:hypothetical protein
MCTCYAQVLRLNSVVISVAIRYSTIASTGKVLNLTCCRAQACLVKAAADHTVSITFVVKADADEYRTSKRPGSL